MFCFEHFIGKEFASIFSRSYEISTVGGTVLEKLIYSLPPYVLIFFSKVLSRKTLYSLVKTLQIIRIVT